MIGRTPLRTNLENDHGLGVHDAYLSECRRGVPQKVDVLRVLVGQQLCHTST